jgi:peptide/nickel transport system ATP-binding protein
MSQSISSETLLEIKNLKMYFPIHKGFIKRYVGDVKAVDDTPISLK